MKEGKIKVSVIMAAYNAEQWIEKSLHSVEQQTLKEIEIIVINDCSSDLTLKLIRKEQKKDNRIRIINLETNVGVARARNVGIKESVGEFLAFLDSDDIWNENKLSIQTEFMTENNCDFSYCDYYLIDKHEKIVGVRKIRENKITKEDLQSGNKIGLLTVMISKKVAKKMCFPEIHHEDYAYWIEITQNGYVAEKCSQMILASYRQHKSLTSNKLRSMRWTWLIFRNFENQTVVRSSISFCKYVIMVFFRRN